MVDLWVPLAAIAICVGLPVLGGILLGRRSQETKHAERMAMIEKGMIIEEPEKKINKYNALRNGLLMIGLSLGAIAGIFVSKAINTWDGDFMIFILSVLGGGIAFIIYFFIARKIQQTDEKEK